MNTSQLECFLAVAEHLNFARASEYLHITQPAVTHQINSLEAELGRQLFKRTTRSVSLTVDGLRFLPDGKKILDDIHMAQVHLQHQDQDTITPFSIGCNNSMELLVLSELLREMKREIPSLHPSVSVLPLRAVENLIQNDSLDVLFGFRNMRGGHTPGRFKELVTAPVACVLPKDHPLLFKSPQTLRLEDLEKEPLAVLKPPKALQAVMEIQNRLVPLHTPGDIYPCDSSEMAVTLVKAGMGVTFLPDLLPLRDRELCYVPLEDRTTVSYGIYYKTRQDRPLVRKFLEIAESYFRKGM